MKQVIPRFGLWVLLLMCINQSTAQSTDRIPPEVQQQLRSIEQQIRRYPHAPDLRIDRGELLFYAGYYSAAVMDYARARSLLRDQEPLTASMLWYKQGVCEYLEGDFQRAEYSFSQAIREAPNAPHPWYFRGKIRMLILDNPYEGESDLLRSLDLAEAISTQTFVARYLLGEIEGAFDELNELLSIAREEDNQKATASLNYQLACLYALTGNEREAVIQLGKAFDLGYADISWFCHDPDWMPLANGELFATWMDRRGLRYMHRYAPPFQPSSREYEQPPLSRGHSLPDEYLVRGDLQWGAPQLIDEDEDAQIAAGERAMIQIPLINYSQNGEGLTISADVQDAFRPYLRLSSLGSVTRIDGEETLMLQWEIEASQDLPEGNIKLTINAQPTRGWGPGPLELSLTAMPLSGLKLEIPDHHFASEYGGDMEPGVPVLLRFAVQNTGELAAAEVEVHIDLPAGVFAAGEEQFEVGTLIPGESRILEFEFFTSRQYEASLVELPITIWSNNRTWRADDLVSVRMNSPLEVTRQVVIRPKPRRLDAEQIQLSSSVDRNLPRALQPNPNALAIVIGNRDYSHPDVPVVDFALQDAASMRRYLIESFGFAEENVMFLTNATQADFHGLFGSATDHRARLFNLVQPEVTEVFIFYSGHGAPDPETQTGYFLPVDCDPTLVRFNGYALETFYNNLSKVPYKSLTVVLDACFSGSSEQGSLIQQASPVRIKTDNPILRDPDAWVLTAAASDQIASWNQEESHGLFTWLFLKAIQGDGDLNQDQLLSFREIREYLSREVPQQARRLHNRYQTPDLYGLDERIIIRYR